MLKRCFPSVFLLIIVPLIYSYAGASQKIQTNQSVTSKKRVILLLHGLNSTPDVWTSDIQKLLAKEFNASVKIFSYSTGLLNNNNIKKDAEIADTLNNFIQEHKLKEKELFIISHSNGAIIALQYIAKYPENHGVKKLVLLGPPLFGSTAADWLNNLPAAIVGAQVQDLQTNSLALLDLNAQIHKSQKYFPETLVLLGTEDTLAPLATGAIPYSFAVNIKIPLYHSELRQIDSRPVLFSSIRDFFEEKPVSSNVTNEDAPNHLVFRIPGLSGLFSYRNGPQRQETLVQPAELLQDTFKFNTSKNGERIYELFTVHPGVEYIGGDTLIVRNLPNKHYKINLSQTLKDWLKTINYDDTNFETWLGYPFKEIKLEVFIHGPGIHVRYFDPNDCQIMPTACMDSMMRRPPFLPSDLMNAINIQDWADAKQLVLAGIGVNQYGRSGSTVSWSKELGKSIENPKIKTPLLAAIEAKQEDLAILLLEHGADPNAVDNDKNTAFSLSVENKLFLLTKKMLATGNITLGNGDKWMTIPMLMALRGNAELLKMVCPKEVDWDAALDAGGLNLLHYAAFNPDPGPLLFLLSKNPPLPKDDKKNTFFSSLLRQNTPEALDRLLDKYPLDPEKIKSSTGTSALHEAACRETPDWLIVLKKHGAFVNKNNQEQSYILASAVRCNRKENVEWLIKNGVQAHGENILVEK